MTPQEIAVKVQHFQRLRAFVGADCHKFLVEVPIDFEVVQVFKCLSVTESVIPESIVHLDSSPVDTSFDVKADGPVILLKSSHILHQDDVDIIKHVVFDCVYCIDPGQQGLVVCAFKMLDVMIQNIEYHVSFRTCDCFYHETFVF